MIYKWPDTHMERCSRSLVVRETLITESTMKYYPIPTGMTIIKKTDDGCHSGSGEAGTLTHCWQECKMVQPLWGTVAIPLKS